MKSALRAVGCGLALVIGASATAGAQTNNFHLGPQIAYDFDIEEFGLGAQFSAPIVNRVEFYPSLMFYFVDPGSFFNVNADIKWRVAKDRPNWLYVGGGLNVARRSVAGEGDTDLGLNLLAGAESLKGRIHPFVEARLILADGSRFQIGAGLNITLGRH